MYSEERKQITLAEDSISLLEKILPTNIFKSELKREYEIILGSPDSENVEEELKELHNAIEQSDPPPMLLRRLALLKAQIGKFDEAMKYAHRVIQIGMHRYLVLIFAWFLRFGSI
jgi:tetratricopeptide (TPR) repeat protein